MLSLDRTDLVLVCEASTRLIADDVKVRSFVNIYGSSIGEGTRIAAFVEIGGAKIGKRCSIQAFVYVCPGVEIGDDVLLATGVVFINHKHPTAVADWEGMEKIVVGDKAVIGARAVILPGVKIGVGAVIGAGAVVTKDVPDGETWVGNPARPLSVGDPGEPQPVLLHFGVIGKALTGAAISALLTKRINGESIEFDKRHDSIITRDRLSYGRWKQGFDVVQGVSDSKSKSKPKSKPKENKGGRDAEGRS